MPTAQQIASFYNSPQAFRDALIIPTADGPQRLAGCVADFQREDFAAIDPAWLAVASGRKPSPRFHWIERTKKASKDSDASVSLLWALAFSKRALDIIIAAGDAEQAAEVRKRAQNLLRHNTWLRHRITIDKWQVKCAETGSVASIITSDAKTTPGQLPDVLIANELTCMSEEFYEALYDNALGNPACLVLLMTNAGHLESWQHTKRGIAESSDLWRFSAYSEPAPWIDEKELAERRKEERSRLRFQRLWCGEWVHDSGEAIDVDLIDKAVVHAGPMKGSEENYSFVASVDIGLSRDATAVCVLAKHVGGVKNTMDDWEPCLNSTQRAMVDLGMMPEPLPPEGEFEIIEGTGKVRLASVHVWRPSKGSRVDLPAVEQQILRLHDRFGFAAVGFDPFQAEHLAARLENAGVPMYRVPFTGSNLSEMCSAVLGGFADGIFELFEHEELLRDLRSLQIVEKSYGVRLDAPRTASGHADAGIAFVIAALMAKHVAGPETEIAYGGAPLCCNDT